jgi:hypothetical protein
VESEVLELELKVVVKLKIGLLQLMMLDSGLPKAGVILTAMVLLLLQEA